MIKLRAGEHRGGAMTTMMLARLSKDGRRVVCGMVDCGTTLAWIVEPKAQNLESEPFVWFPPGWVWQRNGTWTVSARASGRLRQGRKAQAESVIANRQVDAKHPMGYVPYLPAPVVCPRCGFRQTLDAGVLRVAHVAASGLLTACGVPGCPDFAIRKDRGDLPGLWEQGGFCPRHEAEREAGNLSKDVDLGDHYTGGFVRQLAFPDELERWEREPLRFQ
jgi:hypothetical protein